VRVKLDENLPDSVISILGGAGHDVDTARAEGLRGAKDPAVLAGATADDRLLLTLDRGLGDIRAYPPGTHAGIVVVRLDHQSPRAIRDAIERISATVDFRRPPRMRCGVARTNFASVGPNRNHTSSVENYALFRR
jgi:predicted nuclease of predicted toxin-antitoxin system